MDFLNFIFLYVRALFGVACNAHSLLVKSPMPCHVRLRVSFSQVQDIGYLSLSKTLCASAMSSLVPSIRPWTNGSVFCLL